MFIFVVDLSLQQKVKYQHVVTFRGFVRNNDRVIHIAAGRKYKCVCWKYSYRIFMDTFTH